jgi:hypothetical protein
VLEQPGTRCGCQHLRIDTELGRRQPEVMLEQIRYVLDPRA